MASLQVCVCVCFLDPFGIDFIAFCFDCWAFTFVFAFVSCCPTLSLFSLLLLHLMAWKLIWHLIVCCIVPHARWHICLHYPADSRGIRRVVKASSWTSIPAQEWLPVVVTLQWINIYRASLSRVFLNNTLLLIYCINVYAMQTNWALTYFMFAFIVTCRLPTKPAYYIYEFHK